MDSELIIVDVGQGNGAVVRDGSRAIIIDAAYGATMQDVLRSRGVTDIVAIFVSHADLDHIAGITALLLDDSFIIYDVYLNPDSTKGPAWQVFRSALQVANRRRRTRVITSLCETTNDFILGNCKLEVLYPSVGSILGGAGSTDLVGRALTSNSVSAVLRVFHEEEPIVLFPGDADGTALQNMIDAGCVLKARILVYPHHGGRPKGINLEEFVHSLCDKVEPKLVIFSIGRGAYEHPDLDVLERSSECSSEPYIACTQIAHRCMPSLDGFAGRHFTETPSKGYATNSCCSGSVSIQLRGKDTEFDRFAREHSEFIHSLDSPHCVIDIVRDD